MRVLAVCLALAAVPAAAEPLTPDDQAQLRAEYEKETARLRTEQLKKIEEIRAETRLLEQRVAVVRRMVPVQFEAQLIESRLRALALASEVADLEFKRVAGSEKVHLADGGATPYERMWVDLSGRAEYTSAGYFLDRIGRLPLIVELESLRLDAAPLGTVRFAARLGFPSFAGWPEEPPRPAPARRPTYAPPTDARAVFQQALFEQRAAFQRMTEEARQPIRRLQAEIGAMAEMRAGKAPVRFHAAMTRLEEHLTGQKIAFTRARFAEQTVIEGVAVGAPARAALRPAFETAGFVVETLEVAPAGDCRAFSVTARLAPRERDETDAGAVEIGPGRFDADAARCATAAQPPRGNVAARGTGGITMRLRDIDLPDVFRLLQDVAGAGFVVDAAVKGRVNMDVEGATLDEVLTALGAAGVTVGPGPLRRVSPASTRQAPLARAESRDTPVSLSFSDMDLLDVLRLFQEISGRPLWTPAVVDGRVTIFTEAPWDAALEAIAASAGMSAVIEAERIFVGPAAMGRSPWTSGAVEVSKARTADSVSHWGRVGDPRNLGAEDLTPVGFVRTADGLKGVAYSPGRVLWVLKPGVEVSDAKVDAVDAAGITFAAQDGRKSVARFDFK
jgi:Tfp pilus assembly protein PilO